MHRHIAMQCQRGGPSRLRNEGARVREDSQNFFHCEKCDSYFTLEEVFIAHFQDCGFPTASQPRGTIDKTSPQSSRSKDAKPNRKSSEGRVFECPVCMEEQSHLSSMPCGHLFCTSCIRAALQANERCPICCSSARETDLRRIFLPGSG